MIEFLAALAVFIAAHMAPARMGLRAVLIARVGTRRYQIGYSLVSLALVIWVISAAIGAPYVALWVPPAWAYAVPLVMMPAALVLLAAGLATPNPLSITLARPAADATPGAIVRVTRHPVLWGFGLWSAAHIPPNGDLVALILFGGLTALAFGGMAILDARAKRHLGPAWEAQARRTSIVPFVAFFQRRTRLAVDIRLIVSAGIALAAYGWLLAVGHRRLFGADPLAAF